MPRRRADGTVPDWSELCELAASQGGYFAATQAAEIGYSHQLLDYYVSRRRLGRERRGLYHLEHHPRGPWDDLILDWLWTQREGVASHETALLYHQLSDVLPRQRHLTVPSTWKARRLRVPNGLTLHFADLEPVDLGWMDVVQVTTPRRTLADCLQSGLSPDLLDQARREALERGLVTTEDLAAIEGCGEGA